MTPRTARDETNGGQRAEPSEDEDAEPLLLTAAQVAQLLQISLRTLWRLRSGRKLPLPVQLGAAVRWRREEVLQWVTNGCQVVDESDNGRKRR